MAGWLWGRGLMALRFPAGFCRFRFADHRLPVLDIGLRVTGNPGSCVSHGGTVVGARRCLCTGRIAACAAVGLAFLAGQRQLKILQAGQRRLRRAVIVVRRGGVTLRETL
jgi:hypothetical protein